ncbi:MAG: methionine synthase [Gemmatimonadetes bacterium]|nr:methionine synthase [Gemmatimonadota bacterium]NIO31854.1 methionine synthase [Gemmatimonadota bacterium]
MGESRYIETLRERVLVFDGAMGSSVQALGLSAADYGGPQLEGCIDHLVLSRPDVIHDLHASFLEVGCDVIETDSFRANRLSVAEYGLSEKIVELNEAAARIARGAADEFATPDRPRFVAGSIGPSGYLPSASDPTLGNITYAELLEVFREQAQGLIAGGVDLLIIETGQDILEMKAAVAGVRKALREAGVVRPIQVQPTLDTSGRMLLGTNIEAALVTLEALRIDVIGLNCSTGPEHMRQPIRYLCENTALPVSVIPNAGIPHNVDGVAVYGLTPEELAEAHDEFVRKFGVNIVGGCCGTTPDHLKLVVERVWGAEPLARTVKTVPRVASAMEAFDIAQDPAPTLIGERVNSQGSRKVKQLLLADEYDEIVTVGREQVEGGAHLLDVCTALTERQDEAEQMRTLVKLLAQGVPAPLVIDTTEVDVVEAALEANPGRAIINSINLENGCTRIDSVLPLAVEHGAAVIALTIDEEGMAKSADRKLEVARRIYEICLDDYGLRPQDLIYDALTFTLATGDEEFRNSAVDTIEGIRAIKRELPGVFTSLGVSNVSFGLQPQARAVLNSAFLHHCVEAGLDMAIVNAAHIIPYAEVDEEQRALADDLIFNRRDDALARYIAYFQEHTIEEAELVDPTATMTTEQVIHWMILHRKKKGIEDIVAAAIDGRGGDNQAAVGVLNEVLLPAMKEVGDKFGAGELILPFVLQSAEVMKKAVARLETYLDQLEGETKGRVVLATVYGDVHDIGKNLVGTILSNNGYTVYDLGKQVPVNTIIAKAEEVGADAIGLSALLVSTSKQMPLCVQELHARGLDYPVLVGGAAINPSFVRNAAYIDRESGTVYPAGLFYCKDAFAGLATIDALQDPAGREDFTRARVDEIREGVAKREALQQRAKAMRAGLAGPRGPSRDIEVPRPAFWGVRVLERLPLAELFPLIDLNTLYRLHWGAKNAKGAEWERLLKDEYEPRLERYQRETLAGGWLQTQAAYGFFPASSDGNDLVIYDPKDPEREIARFDFPRQQEYDELSLADYFVPGASGERDVVAFQIVSVGSALLEKSDRLMKGGDYSEGYYLHGFGVRLAEAGAEYVHARIRAELGIDPGRGLRYSWGYGACPDHRQHRIVFELLPARERLGMDLTEAGALIPELSTAALVVHHPEAKYFSV